MREAPVVGVRGGRGVGAVDDGEAGLSARAEFGAGVVGVEGVD